jgi:hypothetical protein
MITVLIQINDKVYRFLKCLEALKILKVVGQSASSSQNPYEKYGGKLPSDVADELRAHVAQGRGKVLDTNTPPTQKLSEEYANKFPDNVVEDLQAYVTRSRKEWNSPSI